VIVDDWRRACDARQLEERYRREVTVNDEKLFMIVQVATDDRVAGYWLTCTITNATRVRHCELVLNEAIL
jgi:hypothetical protein